MSFIDLKGAREGNIVNVYCSICSLSTKQEFISAKIGERVNDHKRKVYVTRCQKCGEFRDYVLIDDPENSDM